MKIKLYSIRTVIASIVFAAAFIGVISHANAQALPGGMQSITVPITASGSFTFPAMLSLPSSCTSSNKCPLLIFMHGAGQAGTGFSKIYGTADTGGPTYYIAQGTFPSSFTNPVDGQAYKYIVVAPQATSWSTKASYLPYIISNLAANYPVDTNRIYLTGLSAGGEAAVGYPSHFDPETGSAVVPSYKAAATVPMSAATGGPSASWGTATVQDGTHVWGFGSLTDSHGENTQTYVNYVNTASSGFARFSPYSGGHCCWGQFYNPAYKETINGVSMNMYEWLLQFSQGGSSQTPPTNQAPIVNAGTDQTITLPTSSLTLTGTASDPDGSIASYAWTKTTGGTATIASPSSASTVISGLTQGTYTFKLTVTDNGGATANDTVVVTVNAATPTNAAPTANAGIDQSITLPTSTATLSGSGTDSDGTIASYSWSQQFGPNTATISSVSSASTNISGLIAGSYRFRLTVTDNGGATAFDDMNVTVASAPTGNTNTQTFYVDFGNQDRQTTTSGWNNVATPATGTTVSLIDSTGASTSAALQITDGFYTGSSAGFSANTNGTTTNGVYPSNATVDSFYISPYAATPDSSAQLVISGLSSGTYTFKFFASRMATDSTNRTGQYAIGSTSATLNATNNTSGVATISNVSPTNGSVTVNVSLAPGGSYAYLGVLEIQGSGSTTPPPAGNVAPTANAGVDQTITLPTASVTLTGSGSDSDGTIASYAWTKTTGGTATIASPSAASTVISGLAQGTYTFRLTVTDNGGATATDDVVVTVNAAQTLPVGGKTITISATATGEIYKPNMSSLNILPCDIIQIPAGNYPNGITLGLTSGFAGSSSCPVTIINNGGLVTASYIRIYNAAYFRLTGTGSASYQYGFKLGAAGVNAGLAVADGTTDYETDHLEVTGSEVGLYEKIAPVAGDPLTQYPNWVIKNVKIHDNYIHDTHGEGMYIGHTYPSADPYNGNLTPVRMQNVKIYNNIVDGTDWDGIQLSNARDGAEIYNNTVKNFGRIDMGSQQAGIILGGNTTGVVHDNIIDTGTGNALELFGYGDIQAYNNVIKNAPTTVNQGLQETVYMNDNGALTNIEQNPAQRISFTNNTVITATGSNVRGAILNARNNGTTLAGTVSNNTICDNNGKTLSQLVRTNAGDTMTNNTLNGAGCTGTINNIPTVNAGTDVVITLPTNTVSLSGSVTDNDGTISSYAWTKISGGTATITSPSSASTTISGLAQGTYVFQLAATDNAGGVGSDQITVLVNPRPNANPSVNAGVDQIIQLPTNSVVLTGTAIDSDGDAMTYAWTKTAGGTATITSPSSLTTTVGGLTQGTYTFKLTATDSQGGAGTDTITVTVNGAPNVSPTANAGLDQTLKANSTSVTLSGSGIDTDGTISSYAWTKTAGASVSITSPSNASTTVTGLTSGTYIFRLTVTDNLGAVGTDDVTITVQAAKVNKNPHVKAATITPIATASTTVALAGVATDEDGTITATEWSQVSGTQASIVSPSALATDITGLVTGTYEFSLTATDNDGGISSDIVRVDVQLPTTGGGSTGGSTGGGGGGSSGGSSGGGGGSSSGGGSSKSNGPKVSAGGDIMIQAPISTVVLNGTATADDSITYEWTKRSGKNVSIATPKNATTTVSGLSEGTYIFRLTATDRKGNDAIDEVAVVVKPAPTINIPSAPNNSSRIKVNVQTALRVRSDASITSEPIGSVQGGLGGTVIQEKTGPSGIQWLQVQFDNGTTGWVSKSYTVQDQAVSIPVTTTEQARAVVVAKLLNVRASAGGALLGQVTSGIGGKILSDTGSWLQVQFDNGTTGWVSKAYVQVTGNSGANTNTSSVIVTTTAASLNIRNTPGGTVVGKVPFGTQGTVISREGAWTKVQFPTMTGYVSSSYIR